MHRAISETERRRERQIAHNLALGITPRGIFKQVRDLIDGVYSDKSSKAEAAAVAQAIKVEALSEKDLGRRIKQLEKQMLEHARNLEFEQAARIRDQLGLLREQAFGAAGADNVVPIAGAAATAPSPAGRPMPPRPAGRPGARR
jgi:excinuclease ABC subunit B